MGISPRYNFCSIEFISSVMASFHPRESEAFMNVKLSLTNIGIITFHQ